MKAVILAAGRGERLTPLTDRQPKALIRLSGKPLLEHVINALREAGVEDFILVTGYKGNAIQRYFHDGWRLDVKIRYAYNPFYERGNATSLKAAEKYIGEDEIFLISMADHLFDASMVRKALKESDKSPLLCVDRDPLYIHKKEEATKVLVGEDGYIKDIGKRILIWNGVDTGIFLLNPTIFRIIEMAEEKTKPLTLSYCMKQMIKNHPLWACDVSGRFWIDVDTLEDLTYARMVMRT